MREIRQEAETTRSLTSSELRDMRKDYRCQSGKWATTDEGIQYLRELAVLEVIYSDLDDDEVSKDPEDVLCTRAMWRKETIGSGKLLCGVPHDKSLRPLKEKVDKAAKIEVAQVDLDWERKGELFVARWAHETSGHLGRDATYRWAHDRGVDLTMEAITQVTHECETCAAIK
ncbi:hypothetical protein GRJ2_003249900 [Grus japonensis]|uniref:Integrase zinc-binding domain-containing protein n=1 Tax=Grus japonensis TaxID=30415 RepID=A0ABC9YE25_GRUJA